MSTYRCKTVVISIACWFCMTVSALCQQSLDKLIESEIPSLVATYKNAAFSSRTLGCEEKGHPLFLGKGIDSLGYTVNRESGQI